MKRRMHTCHSVSEPQPRGTTSASGSRRSFDQARVGMENTMRPLTIAAACLMILVSGPAHVGSAAARGAGWNQVAADAAARPSAAEGKCYPFNGPCPVPPGILHPTRHRISTRHNNASRQHADWAHASDPVQTKVAVDPED